MDSQLYYTFILHQTTTLCTCHSLTCLLYYTFILHQTTTTSLSPTIHAWLYYTFILHQTTTILHGSDVVGKVVLYLHSTSNHNALNAHVCFNELYYTFILHQTTTICWALTLSCCCIIPSFYIKPQLQLTSSYIKKVVLYLHSTSNHNCASIIHSFPFVVLYLHSTSNHNFSRQNTSNYWLYYTFILHQTTTYALYLGSNSQLYYTFILHQTTTRQIA